MTDALAAAWSLLLAVAVLGGLGLLAACLLHALRRH